ncbi:MAG: hypothetical protein WCO57_08350 [Verrucomicrobiota bacterium]
MAVSISMRNAPGDRSPSTRSVAGTSHVTQGQPNSQPFQAESAAAANLLMSDTQARHAAEGFRVTLHETRLAALPTEQQSVWRTRASAVEADARVRLERLTAELELTCPQRDKMFPVLVRSTPGYDPVMLVGGPVAAAAATSLAALEEIHQVLDPAQQVIVEDQEVNRQLWWQDTISRLEANLIESINAAAATPAVALPTPVAPAPATEELSTPAAHATGNLFDLLEPKP